MNDEEEKAIKVVNKRTERLTEELKIEEEDLIDEPKIAYLITQIEANKTLINLIERQQKEIEELKEENKEIRDWKYVIDNPIDLKKLSELDLIKIFGKVYIAEDKIKTRIKELEEYLYKGNIKDDFLMIRIKVKIQELQSLLEKE